MHAGRRIPEHGLYVGSCQKIMLGGTNMFLEVKDIYKSFGEGDSRVDVLRGISL